MSEDHENTPFLPLNYVMDSGLLNAGTPESADEEWNDWVDRLMNITMGFTLIGAPITVETRHIPGKLTLDTGESIDIRWKRYGVWFSQTAEGEPDKCFTTLRQLIEVVTSRLNDTEVAATVDLFGTDVTVIGKHERLTNCGFTRGLTAVIKETDVYSDVAVSADLRRGMADIFSQPAQFFVGNPRHLPLLVKFFKENEVKVSLLVHPAKVDGVIEKLLS